MKKNKGFTLVELLAVIVVLGILMTVASMAVIKNMNDSKAKTKYMAAKDIVNILDGYLASETDGITLYESGSKCVSIKNLIDRGYIEQDTTNPRTGENTWDFNGLDQYTNACYIVGDLSSARAYNNQYKPIQGGEIGDTEENNNKYNKDCSYVYYFDHYYYRYWTCKPYKTTTAK